MHSRARRMAARARMVRYERPCPALPGSPGVRGLPQGVARTARTATLTGRSLQASSTTRKTASAGAARTPDCQPGRPQLHGDMLPSPAASAAGPGDHGHGLRGASECAVQDMGLSSVVSAEGGSKQ
mmetsp:Transcript_33224/g.86156  ORF Transcript_33224/g.86156 Transcript_33224/m.86156 type:complete len:126 (-) Transcript_33224:696-1073(-)